MNRELVDNLRLDAGIARLTAEWDNALVCVNKEGKVIDPIGGLSIFAKLIVEECIKSISPDKELPQKFDMETLDTFIIDAVRTECVAEIKKRFGIE